MEVLRLSRISTHVTTSERATIFNKSWIIDQARGDGAGHFIVTPLIAIVKSRLFGQGIDDLFTTSQMLISDDTALAVRNLS